MPLILSLDGGSTSLKIGLLDTESQRIISQLTINRAFSYKTITDPQGVQYLDEILSQLPKEGIKKIVLGISGADTETEISDCSNKISGHFKTQYPEAEIKIFNDVDYFFSRVKISATVQPGQLIMYHGWESYQFKGGKSARNVMASPLNPIEMVGDYPYLKPVMAVRQPGQSDRDTRVEIEKV